MKRKKGYAKPIRKVKLVLDYYNHSATGDYFGGQSYLSTDYADITVYNNKFLADYLDFRPGVKNLYSGTGTVSSPAYVNCSTLDFKSRVFPTSGYPAASSLTRFSSSEMPVSKTVQLVFSNSSRIISMYCSAFKFGAESPLPG